MGLFDLVFIALIVYVFYRFYHSRSSFSKETDKTYIFVKPGCGWCEKSMGEFKKAEAASNGNIKIVSYPDKMIDSANITGFPEVKKLSGEVFSGSRTADEILEFAKK
jgi:hypothetical protein